MLKEVEIEFEIGLSELNFGENGARRYWANRLDAKTSK